MSSVSFYFCFYDRPKTSTQFLVLEVIARRGWSSFFKTEGLNYTYIGVMKGCNKYDQLSIN